MSEEKSLFQQLRSAYRKKRGVGLARGEIQCFLHGYSFSEIEKTRQHKFDRYDGHHRNSSFLHGWMSVWLNQGADDAKSGFCRADKYNNEWYNRRWCEFVDTMRKHGWRNPQLDREFEDLLKQLSPPSSSATVPRIHSKSMGAK